MSTVKKLRKSLRYLDKEHQKALALLEAASSKGKRLERELASTKQQANDVWQVLKLAQVEGSTPQRWCGISRSMIVTAINALETITH